MLSIHLPSVLHPATMDAGKKSALFVGILTLLGLAHFALEIGKIYDPRSP
ncbi:uncharacterized protein TRAVEDRAFT_54537 [Trametes versicolor FP-101664 SS1]|nr:uncharacterized protein TRAVEDRAFT_54537 [Trametes versicolor FP-101664 SS1]EIW51501.1 hypothetical protein TRAVEDRAFT_54537 [Trametes versicolor FP-101664 SS1]